MTKEDIYFYLEELNHRLRKLDTIGEMFLYGEAVMCISFNARVFTHDIDALFEPKSVIYHIIGQMSEEFGLPKNWLNDSVKGFVSSNNDVIPLYDLSNLKIYTATPEYIFAMKAMAARTNEESKDLEDLIFFSRSFKVV